MRALEEEKEGNTLGMLLDSESKLLFKLLMEFGLIGGIKLEQLILLKTEMTGMMTNRD